MTKCYFCGNEKSGSNLTQRLWNNDEVSACYDCFKAIVSGKEEYLRKQHTVEPNPHRPIFNDYEEDTEK